MDEGDVDEASFKAERRSLYAELERLRRDCAGAALPLNPVTSARQARRQIDDRETIDKEEDNESESGKAAYDRETAMGGVTGGTRYIARPRYFTHTRHQT